MPDNDLRSGGTLSFFLARFLFAAKRCDSNLNTVLVQEGKQKLLNFVTLVKRRKRQNKVEALEDEVMVLDPVLRRFWTPFPQISCPFVGEFNGH